MEELKPQTRALLERMERCSLLPYRWDEKKIVKNLKEIYKLVDVKFPSKITVCKDIFDERFAIASASARASASAIASASARASAIAIARARASASAIAIANASASDYDFDYFCGEIELADKGNPKYIEIMEYLLRAKEAGLGYLIDVEVGGELFIAPNPIVKIVNNSFHSETLPAIEYATQKFYFLDGVNLKKELWKKILSNTLSFKEIMAIEISDQRTVALKYNPQAIIKENAVLIHKDNRHNELYKIEGQEINKELSESKIWFLKMLCPTGRIFVEGVPPTEAEKNPNATAMQALLCGLSYSEYMGMVLES
jgi:hypothetical protein